MTATTADAGRVLVREDGPAATITLNRPDKRNALSLELMQELITVLDRLGADARVRAIVIEGAGPAFSAGHDLSEMVGRDAGFYQRLFDTCTELMTAIHRVPQPVIARVHGIATAATAPARGGAPGRRSRRAARGPPAAPAGGGPSPAGGATLGVVRAAALPLPPAPLGVRGARGRGRRGGQILKGAPGVLRWAF